MVEVMRNAPSTTRAIPKATASATGVQKAESKTKAPIKAKPPDFRKARKGLRFCAVAPPKATSSPLLRKMLPRRTWAISSAWLGGPKATKSPRRIRATPNPATMYHFPRNALAPMRMNAS